MEGSKIGFKQNKHMGKYISKKPKPNPTWYLNYVEGSVFFIRLVLFCFQFLNN